MKSWPLFYINKAFKDKRISWCLWKRLDHVHFITPISLLEGVNSQMNHFLLQITRCEDERKQRTTSMFSSSAWMSFSMYRVGTSSLLKSVWKYFLAPLFVNDWRVSPRVTPGSSASTFARSLARFMALFLISNPAFCKRVDRSDASLICDNLREISTHDLANTLEWLWAQVLRDSNSKDTKSWTLNHCMMVCHKQAGRMSHFEKLSLGAMRAVLFAIVSSSWREQIPSLAWAARVKLRTYMPGVRLQRGELQMSSFSLKMGLS